MRRILIFLVFLLILGVLGLIGYSYSGYLQPEQREITQPVDLDVE